VEERKSKLKQRGKYKKKRYFYYGIKVMLLGQIYFERVPMKYFTIPNVFFISTFGLFKIYIMN